MDGKSNEIFERLGSIEAKIDDISGMRDEIRGIITLVHVTDKTALQAKAQSDTNRKDIDRLEHTLKWAVGILTSILIPITVAVLNILIG